MNHKQRKFVDTICRALPGVLVWAVLPGLLPQAGCAPGIVSVLGTPTSAETKVTPEFDVTKELNQKILIIVEQPYYLKAHPNLRYFITDSIIKMLEKRAEIKPQFMISYDALAEFRSSTPDFSMLSPEEIGAKLGADLVLFVTISNCQISDKAESGFFNGLLEAQAQLIRVKAGEKLWPTVEQARAVRVSFEMERRGPDIAAVRLATAAAHCITRYLYNCPKNQFKIPDETSDVGWGK